MELPDILMQKTPVLKGSHAAVNNLRIERK